MASLRVMRKLGDIARVQYEPHHVFACFGLSSLNNNKAFFHDSLTLSTSSTTTATMAPPIDPGGSVPTSVSGKSFFEVFPRELRDKIYDFSFDHEAERRDYTMQFRAPLPHLRLVSRQFKQEYDQQLPSKTTLVVSDHNNEFLGFLFPPQDVICVPSLAKRCTALHFTQNMQDSWGHHSQILSPGMLRKHFRSIEQTFTQRLDHLQEIHVRIDFNIFKNVWMLHGEPEDGPALFISRYFPKTWKHSKVVTIEFCYPGLTYPSPPGRLTSSIPDPACLDELATLGTIQYRDGHTEAKAHYDIVKQRITVEKATRDAWETEHGCTLTRAQGC